MVSDMVLLIFHVPIYIFNHGLVGQHKDAAGLTDPNDSTLLQQLVGAPAAVGDGIRGAQIDSKH
jgi:hypothetical protein